MNQRMGPVAVRVMKRCQSRKKQKMMRESNGAERRLNEVFAFSIFKPRTDCRLPPQTRQADLLSWPDLHRLLARSDLRLLLGQQCVEA